MVSDSHPVSFANDFLTLNTSFIGLVKGSNLQMDRAIRKQVEMGCVSFAMSTRELLRDHLQDGFLPGVLRTLRRQRDNKELLLYGAGHKLKHSGVNYGNLSWFVEAKRGLYFKDGFLYLLDIPDIRFEEYDCEVCIGIYLTRSA